MPSTKISALTSGATPQAGDLHVLARGTTNRKLTTAELFSEELPDLAALQTKIDDAELIAGRWYSVNDSNVDGDLLFLATGSNTISSHGYIKSGSWTYAATFNVTNLGSAAVLLHDVEGQIIQRSTCTDWPLNNGSFTHNYVVGSVYESAKIITRSTIHTSNFYDPLLTLTSCTAHGAYFNTGNVNTNDFTFYNCTFNSCEMVNQGGASVSNSHFQNVRVIFQNNPTVNNLTIIGKTEAEDTLTYLIDGSIQSQVENLWAGTVIGDPINGSSTVSMIVNYSNDDTSNLGTYEIGLEGLNVGAQLVVGVFKFPPMTIPQYVGSTVMLTYIQGANGTYATLNHPIRLVKLADPDFSTILCGFTTLANSWDQPCWYHGKTAKVGELSYAGSFVEIFQQINTDGFPSLFVKYGAHYDY